MVVAFQAGVEAIGAYHVVCREWRDSSGSHCTVQNCAFNIGIGTALVVDAAAASAVVGWLNDCLGPRLLAPSLIMGVEWLPMRA